MGGSAFEPTDTQQLDFLILRDGPVVLYDNQADLEMMCEWFRRHSYLLYSFDCRKVEC